MSAPPLSVRLQHLLPQRALTQALGWLAGARGGALTTAAVRAFIARYGVDMAEAAQPDPAAYASFNDFFTRALRPGARPLADSPWVCPVDGAVSQLGAIEDGRIVQAKGHDYSVLALVGGDTALAETLRGGSFATLYLSPRDYHRIHMPRAGRLRRMEHVPGDLFSVNPVTAAHVPGLFARNERVVCVFDPPPSTALPAAGPNSVRGAVSDAVAGRDPDSATGAGAVADNAPWVLVLVGATIVGSMATTWHGVVNPPRTGVLRAWDYAADAPQLDRGAEMGRFLLGSTVVLLSPRRLRFEASWQPGSVIRMGQAMAWDV